MLTRRHFLGALSAGTGAMLARPFDFLAPPAKLDRIGIQAYTVRHLLRKDFDGTLSKLGALGYSEFELWGHRARDPKSVRAALDRAGLRAPSSHFDFSDIRDDDGRLLDGANVIGQQYITAASIDSVTRRTVDDWKRLADQFNETGRKVAAAGLRFAYHNHEFELDRLAEQTLLDVLLTGTDPLVVAFEMDVYWMTIGGADPLAYIDRYPDRFEMLHLKDSSGPPHPRQVDLGTGTIDFVRILRNDRDRKHSVRHVFAEHDEPPNPLVFARKSLTYLKNLEF